MTRKKSPPRLAELPPVERYYDADERSNDASDATAHSPEQKALCRLLASVARRVAANELGIATVRQS
jgi:hypothetical protein